MNKLLFTTAVGMALTLTACQESPTETATDVAKARQEAESAVIAAKREANQEIADAQAKVAETQAEARDDILDQAEETGHEVNKAYDAMTTVAQEAATDVRKAQGDAVVAKAKALHDIKITEAKGVLKIALEKCDAFQGSAQDDCQDRAQQVYEDMVAKADAERGVVIANNK